MSCHSPLYIERIQKDHILGFELGFICSVIWCFFISTNYHLFAELLAYIQALRDILAFECAAVAWDVRWHWIVSNLVSYYCGVWADSLWRGSAARLVDKRLCRSLAGCGRAGSAGSCSSGGLVFRNLYLTVSTFGCGRLSLGRVWRIWTTVDVLSESMKYSRLEGTVWLFLGLLAFEQFERVFDVFKVVGRIVIVGSQGHVSWKLEYVVSAHPLLSVRYYHLIFINRNTKTIFYMLANKSAINI